MTVNRRDFLKRLCVGAAAVTTGGRISFGAGDKEDKRNIVLIMADDLGYGDLVCYGNKTIKTPNLDALAKGGMRFTDFHSNGAMCSPTRAALLTGRYQQRAGIESVLSGRSNYETGMALEEITFAEVLKAAGYATACFGKWHLGFTPAFNPVRQGFDTYRGFVAGGSDYHSHIDRSGRPDWWMDDKLLPEEGYTTALLTEHAVRFIESNKDRPFCAYVPYQAVHFPFQGPNDEADRVVGGDYWSKAKYGRRYDDVEDRKLAYKEMVESLDAGVGRIVKKLDELGLGKKTLVFFTSDNGAYRWVGSNLPCRGQKGDLWEGGHRVPAIAYWPGRIKPGTVTGETALTMDLFVTMAAVAGAELPAGRKLDGVNILPVLLEGRKLPERTVFWRTNGQGAARKGPWKLIMRGKKQGDYTFVGLFNLDDDIAEDKNLAEAKPEMIRMLRAEFEAWEKDVTAGVTWVRK
ncbi:MAG TPA: sulfatase-like hydrolase/transferase [Sedimentisphaerales bacterium]|nr:sulfatase-like hydrolase/transferase [Sedimentisphaerales bacterium]